MGETRVLGVDLASSSWSNNGTALLAWSGADWTQARPGCLTWPRGALDPVALANTILAYARDQWISAISLDGPQAWRDPARPGPGKGRRSEYETRTPGKTGARGVVFPRTYKGWVEFSLAVFDHLQAEDDVLLANASTPSSGDGRILLLECFPTSTWRSSGLRPLPGKAASNAERIRERSQALQARYGLPPSTVTTHHDDLQALVAALPAAGLLGGPCRALPRGEPMRSLGGAGPEVDRRVEGLIWDAEPLAGSGTPEAPAIATETETARLARDVENPILPDPRDEAGEEAIRRGVACFARLVELANAGEAVGVGYAQFVAIVHGVSRFADVAGTGFKPSHIEFVVRLAGFVTEAAGRKAVTRGGVTIQAGMDTFIWKSRRPHHRDAKAWTSPWGTPPYSREQWEAVFPRVSRRLLTEETAIAGAERPT